MCFQHNVAKQNLHVLDKKNAVTSQFNNRNIAIFLEFHLRPVHRLCKSITQVRGIESVPIEEMESNVRLD